MVAGVMAGADYFMGHRLHDARAANPGGFFEDVTINALNEALLAAVAPADLGEGQRWLADLPIDAVLPEVPRVTQQIAALVRSGPLCFKDPRFVYTLPHWLPHLPPDTGIVCVFRHPALTATSIVAECQRAAYLDGVAMDLDRAMRIWTAAYSRALALAESSGLPWLFVHYDQIVSGEGVAAMARFTGAPLHGGVPDRTLRRPPPEMALSAEAEALYARLCDKAGFVPTTASVEAPRISVICLAKSAADVRPREDRGVVVERVIVDRSPDGDLTCPGATVIRCDALSEGAAWRAGIEAAQHDLIALEAPACWPLPNQLARTAEALLADSAAEAVSCDYHLSPDGDAFTGRVQLAEHGGQPPPGWWGGVLFRRAALASLSTAAFAPVLLSLYRSLLSKGAVKHLAVPLFAMKRGRFARMQRRAAEDAARLEAGAWPGSPALTVSLCTYNRAPVLRECLAALCRQTLPVGLFNVVVVDDGSTDSTQAMLSDVDWPIPVTVVRRSNGGLAAARNTGLAQTTAPLVLFINDDTIAPPDLIHAHLSAHARQPNRAVLGGFVQPKAAMDGALTAAVEAGGLMFCFSALQPGGDNPSDFFYTCNVSAPTEAVRQAGGFDESFRHYGAEDTDLGLRLGLPVHYLPAATAMHRHPYSFDYVRHRAKQVARAHIRLWRKHPDRCTSPDLTVDAARRYIASKSAEIEVMEQAAEELSRLSLGTLRKSGLSDLADKVVVKLIGLLQTLTRLWWIEGMADGLVEHGFTDMASLLAEHAIPCADGPVWLMAPGHQSDWVAIRDRFAALRPSVTLALIADAPGGLTADTLAAACADFADPDAPSLTIVSTGLQSTHDVRLLAGAQGWLRSGGTSDDHMARLAAIAGCPEIQIDGGA